MHEDRHDPWSTTTAELYGRVREQIPAGEQAVLATIVDVEGAAYRRPGAKMLITEQDDSFGAITAGCLEDPVISIAKSVLSESRPRVETFDLMDGDEWGLGLGCNGIIDVLLEPLDSSYGTAVELLDDHQSVTVCTAIESSTDAVSIGDRTLVTDDETVLDESAAGDNWIENRSHVPESIITEAWDSITKRQESGGATTVDVEYDDGTVTMFIDHHEPVPELVLFGNQNDVHPVSRVARDAGFDVTVYSTRGSRSDITDFPHATRVVSGHPTSVDDAVSVPERTFVVLMSHNLIDDRLALETLLDETDVPYIGLMGPRERFEEIRTDLNEDGIELSAEDRERIATPVGLDIGGGEPIQIALSIVSEVLAVSNDREGGRLKDRTGPIHRRVEAT